MIGYLLDSIDLDEEILVESPFMRVSEQQSKLWRACILLSYLLYLQCNIPTVLFFATKGTLKESYALHLFR